MNRVSLQMYDPPALRPAVDAFWAGLARALRAEGIDDLPGELERGSEPYDVWLSPDLLLAQTCGYPLTHALRDRVTLLAVPVYRIQGREESRYCSYILVREDDPAVELADLRDRRAAVNGEDSQSGYSVLRHAVAPLARGQRFFSEVKVSGAHLNSAGMVRRGDADICAFDAVAYALAQQCDTASLAGLRILAETAWAPNLPFITRKTATDDLLARLRAALSAAMTAPDLAGPRNQLLLAGIEVLPLEAYDRILELEDEAGRLGYPKLV